MAKVWQILLHPDHPEALVKLVNFQWDVYGTKLDFLTTEDHPVMNYPSLNEISKTMKEKPRQKRGRNW